MEKIQILEYPILITGGAGYIGSVVAKYLSDRGLKVIIYDNLSTGSEKAIDDSFTFIKGDLFEKEKLIKTIKDYNIKSVMHFAAFSLVGESVENPYKYYQNNICGTLSLLDVMRKTQCKNIVFSSTAAVYGIPKEVPLKETSPLSPINPYGRSKLFMEEIIKDFSQSYGIKYVIFRYFNACGCYKDKGERHDPETHLIPNLFKAYYEKKNFYIFGSDYPTKDGTCIRDFIDVIDLAKAHLKGLESIQDNPNQIYNLGTKKGYSIREILNIFKKVIGALPEIKEKERRRGDPPILIADYSKAEKNLNWKPEITLEETLKNLNEWWKRYL